MAKIRSFIKQEKILFISLTFSILSAFFVHPDILYLDYIDVRTLALLYCLMVVVAGIRKAGTFSRMAHILCIKASDTRALSFILVFLCFFSSMFITNDVALLTFVPFSVAVLGMAEQNEKLIRVVVLQTVAANLGSMLTPVGNPQNIFIQSYYNLSSKEFIYITLPIWLASLILIALLCLTVPKTKLSIFLGEKPILKNHCLLIYSILFIICILSVIRIIEWPAMLLIIIVVLLVYDRKTLLDADFMLLLTFVCFFIFSGNLARLEIINISLRNIIQTREYLISVVTSQVISNVPSALLLSNFTSDAKNLLLGVNIGGLGTPIASLASLISLKLYSHSTTSNNGKYLLEFSITNILLLSLLSLITLLF